MKNGRVCEEGPKCGKTDRVCKKGQSLKRMAGCVKKEKVCEEWQVV